MVNMEMGISTLDNAYDIGRKYKYFLQDLQYERNKIGERWDYPPQCHNLKIARKVRNEK